MGIPSERLRDLIFGGADERRYTQDSPILPDVWMAFAARPDEPVDLLLTPHRDVNAGRLAKALRDRLAAEPRARRRDRAPAQIAFAQGAVVARLGFDQLIRVALPMTPWWQRYVWRGSGELVRRLDRDPEAGVTLDTALEAFGRPPGDDEERSLSPDLLWMARIVATIEHARSGGGAGEDADLTFQAAAARIQALLRDLEVPRPDQETLLWLVGLNRTASTAVARSTLAVKADAARRLFEVSCASLTWAVVDSGIDTRHPAFRQRREDGLPWPRPFDDGDGRDRNRTRVLKTYDFNRIRPLLDPDNLTPARFEELHADGGPLNWVGEDHWAALRELAPALKRSLQTGREVEWGVLEPFLEIEHTPDDYRPPANDHGTHVAGILAGDWHEADGPDRPPMQGVCPDLRLYDLRVLGDDGHGSEFNVIAALQFVRYLNAHHDHSVIHGANLSLSIRHDVTNYACGRTPVCDECERAVANGVVVVAAAGNLGTVTFRTQAGPLEGYHAMSVTDPGNAEGVITVGATHRSRPHTYGVSYFSSRGPTGDGRVKPDLVAPGEKITAPTPGDDRGRRDGTSMAAPHVSGAAAMLMARHHELIGETARIKRILCDTATDLGRERFFQGHGMLDVLRALQSV